MNTKFVFDFILPFFTGNDELRPIFNNIHKGDNGYLYASNGDIGIRVPHQCVMKKYKEIEKYPNLEKLIQDGIDREGNTTAIIHTNDLIHILSGIAWRRITTADKCKECNGIGECTCDQCDSNYTCKKCDGTGIVNNRIKEYSLLKTEDIYIIGIGSPAFSADLLQIIAISAQMLQEEHITYRYKTETMSGIFSFAGIDIILMPRLIDIADEIMILHT